MIVKIRIFNTQSDSQSINKEESCWGDRVDREDGEIEENVKVKLIIVNKTITDNGNYEGEKNNTADSKKILKEPEVEEFTGDSENKMKIVMTREAKPLSSYPVISCTEPSNEHQEERLSNEAGMQDR